MGQNEQKDDYRVSVVIPAYNAEKYISRTIESVLAQSRRADEIIVVDDGSVDGTGEVVTGFRDKVRYIRQENSGASAARNTGIKAAEYDWVAFLDADDVWLENKLQTQISLLERNPDLMWCGGNYYNYLESSNRKGPRYKSGKIRQMMGGKEFWNDYYLSFAAGVWGWTGTMIINRKALKEAGMFKVGQLRANDLDMWFRVANLYPEFGFTCEPLAVYYLEIEESITQKQAYFQWQVEFLSRHLEITKEYGRLEAFEPCVAYMLKLWTRSMLFDARTLEIKNLIARFGYLLPLYFRAGMKVLTTFPKFTRAACRGISCIVRKLNLRRQIVRKPK